MSDYNDDEILPLGQTGKKKRIYVSEETKVEIDAMCKLRYSSVTQDFPRGYPALLNKRFQINTAAYYCEKYKEKVLGKVFRNFTVGGFGRLHRATGKPVGRQKTFKKEDKLNAFNFVGQKFSNIYMIPRPCDFQFALKYDHGIIVSRRTISRRLNYDLHATIAQLHFKKEFVRDPATVPIMKIFSFGEFQDFSDFQQTYSDLPELCFHGNLSTSCQHCKTINEQKKLIVDIDADEKLHEELVVNPRGEITHVYDREYNAVPLFSHKYFHPDAAILNYGTRVLLWDDIGPPTASLCHTYKNDCVEVKPIYDSKVYLYYPHIEYELIRCKCPDCSKLRADIEEEKEAQRAAHESFMLKSKSTNVVSSADSDGVVVHKYGARERRIVLDEDGNTLFDCVV
jgi:hypothetical protein